LKVAAASEKVVLKEPKSKNKDNENSAYFWNNHLHQEFMIHFSVFGKTWKVVSSMMYENGIKDKD
jgi:cupin superfamily acireductone dioxygenase involved in methionine salvage